jgi:hypothetical protein
VSEGVCVCVALAKLQCIIVSYFILHLDHLYVYVILHKSNKAKAMFVCSPSFELLEKLADG